MVAELKPLFVRVAATEADRLDRVATQTGQSKRKLVENAVRTYLGDELVVGHASVTRPAAEILTPAEAAAFLRVDEPALLGAAEAGEVPARRIGEAWRFSRAALLDWFASNETPAA